MHLIIFLSDIKVEPDSTEIKKDKFYEDSKDNHFKQYRKLCASMAEESGYNAKSALVDQFLNKGSSGGNDDVGQWINYRICDFL